MQNSSAACSDNGPHAALSCSGVDFCNEDWASEGEEIAELHDCSQGLHSSEEQVIDCLGGYVVTRLARQQKLPCADCRDALLAAHQGIFVQEKQIDGAMLLKSSSPALKDFLLSAEIKFRFLMRPQSFTVKNDIGRKLHEEMLLNTPVLPCCHPTDAANAVLTLYLRVRLHHYCKLFNRSIAAERKQRKKNKKFKKLNVLSTSGTFV